APLRRRRSGASQDLRRRTNIVLPKVRWIGASPFASMAPSDGRACARASARTRGLRRSAMLHKRASRMVAVLLCLSSAALQAEEPAKTSDFSVYGRLNISFDYGSQGFGGVTCNNANSCGAVGQTPQGVTHWLPDVASNLSRFGARGSRWFV